MVGVQQGQGVLETSLVYGRTVITRSLARNPLKLLCPRRHGNAAWVYTSTFGGGLLAGDTTDLSITVGARTSCCLGTQSSTKIYKSPNGKPSRQNVSAEICEEGLLAVTPDPVTCFKSAVYEQKQRFEVKSGGNLVLVDWLTSGRHARNESWQFSRYLSHNDIFYDSKRIFTDVLLLDAIDGPLRSPFRLGRFHCLAVVVFVGPETMPTAERILESVSAKPTEKRPWFIDAASSVPHGMVFRALGVTTEHVSRVLRENLSFLSVRLGDEPWGRKW